MRDLVGQVLTGATSSTRSVERSSPEADTPYATSVPSRDGWYQSMAAVSSSTDVHRIEDDGRLVRPVAVERTHAQHGLVVMTPAVEREDLARLDPR